MNSPLQRRTPWKSEGTNDIAGLPFDVAHGPELVEARTRATSPRHSALGTARSTTAKHGFPRFQRGAGERGFALIVVLLVVALLGLVVGDLALYSWYSLRVSQNFGGDLQHMAAADGLMRAASASLSTTEFTATQRKQLLAEGIAGLKLGDALADASFEDESGKLNLNGMADADAALQEKARAEWLALAATLKIDETLAAAVADFIQARAGTGDAGGESAGGIVLLEELRAVEGMTDALLYSAGGVDSQALSGYVTCWGTGGVNVNTASKEVLDAVLAEVAPGKADVLLQYRASKEFESLAEVVQALGLDMTATEQLSGRLSFEGRVMQMTVTTRSGASRMVTHVVIEPGTDGNGFIRLCRRSQ